MRLVILLLVLCGCASVPPDIRTVTLELVASDREMIKKCGHSLFLTAPLGCAKVQGSFCTIVAYAPRTFEDRRKLETLGHELWHCYKGDRNHAN